MHEVNHVDISNYSEDIEVNEAHIRNPNYKGKNYDPNYQQNRNNRMQTPTQAQQGTITGTWITRETPSANLMLKITIPATKDITPRRSTYRTSQQMLQLC